MLFIRLEGMTRFVGLVLMICVGILIALFVMTYSGGAIPVERFALNPNYLQGLPPSLTFSDTKDSLFIEYKTVSPQTAVSVTTEWLTSPFRTGALIMVGVVVALDILYLFLRRMYGSVPEEIFP